jgi:glycyl-tRNA synthetase beta chain
MPDFLLEIGCEEIPARMIEPARTELSRVSSLLLAQRLVTPDQVTEESFKGPDNTQGKVITPELTVLSGHSASSSDLSQSFSTPRRVAFFYPGVLSAQEDREEQVPGPAVKVAFKDGKPTPAAEAFAKKVNLPLEKIGRMTTPKGEYLSATLLKKGRPAIEVLAETLPKEIAAIYWPKNMYWRAGKPERFVRPIRWIVALLDGEVIPLEFGGIKASNKSRGHRLLGMEHVLVSSPSQYVEVMRAANVEVAYADRDYRIRKALDAATRTVPDAYWRPDPELFKTVVNLTEWPSAILGNFDKQFLSLPEEVLVTVMRDHQKYFAVEDANTHWLLPHFLAVLNTDGDPDGLIRHGNERVLRARFNDARFFWDADHKTPFVNRVQMLTTVTFQKDLGSYYDKTGRVLSLATNLAMGLGKAGLKVRPDVVAEAARFAKADLTTELVKEFTELQGIIGGLYIRSQGLLGREKDPEFVDGVSDAIYDHYKPTSSEGPIPRTAEGGILSIADKADSIVGMFALGLAPSGSKDPFALRRQANGIVKILAEHELPLRLGNLIGDSLQTYEGTEAATNFKKGTDATSVEIYQFFKERLQFYLRDVLQFRYDAVNAVLEGAYERGDDEIPDLIERSKAVAEICTSVEFEPLFVAFKRIKNIIRQAREKGFPVPELQAEEKFESDAEIAIWNELRRLASSYLPLRKQRKYLEAFRALAKVRGPVDRFFDSVMVMVDDPDVRAKRLGLLNYLLETFNTIADLSELAAEAK